MREVFDTLSEDRRAEVARRFATTWYGTDADAARAWATGLAAGAVRDEAVTGIIEYAGFQPADEALMDLYSSDTARAEAVVGMLDNIARRDPRTARKLVDDYVEDPALRERAELLLQSFER